MAKVGGRGSGWPWRDARSAARRKSGGSENANFDVSGGVRGGAKEHGISGGVWSVDSGRFVAIRGLGDFGWFRRVRLI